MLYLRGETMGMPKIEIKEYGGAVAMLRDCADWLEERAALNNLQLGLLYRLGRREETGAEVHALLVAVFQEGKPKMTFLQTPPRECILVSDDQDWELAVKVAADWMRVHFPELPGVVGPEPQVSTFVQGYHPVHQLIFRQATMRLDHLEMPKPAAGWMRLSEPGDVNLITAWLKDFFVESLSKPLSTDEASQLAKAKIVEKNFWIWEVEGRAVSMAGVERPTRKGITVVLVYTPVAERGHGYASNLVAQITDLQLRTGRDFCCLHTDADFPTSNKIYKALGYYEIGWGSLVRFAPAKSEP